MHWPLGFGLCHTFFLPVDHWLPAAVHHMLLRVLLKHEF